MCQRVALFSQESTHGPRTPAQQATRNAAAIAWLDAWYATPDDSPPGFWEGFEALLAMHPLDFSTPCLESDAEHQINGREAL
jgi:hypothetical protein